MTDQPIEPRRRDDEQNPETVSPHPDPEPSPDEDEDGVEACQALSGSDSGSDTRAGSLRGGSSTGSERDDAQAASDRYLADLGQSMKTTKAQPDEPKGEPRKGLTNTGHASDQSDGPGDNADAATG